MPDHRERLKSIEAVIAQGPFEATWESLENYRIPEWYKNDKFGIFIHWGAYCVPAFGNEWYPRLMYLNEEHKKGHYFNHHVETYGPQKQFGYKDFIPMFKAEKFDPADWAALFEQSGARSSSCPWPSITTASRCTIAPFRSGPRRKKAPGAT